MTLKSIGKQALIVLGVLYVAFRVPQVRAFIGI